MPKIYLGYDNLGSGGLGTTHSGGGTIQEYTQPEDIATGASANNTTTTLDFSNGITYNSDTGQWIGAVANDGFYIYDSLEDMGTNTGAQRIGYTGGFNFNNGIAYKADTNTYVTTYFANNQIYLDEFSSLEDAATYTGQIAPTQNGAPGVRYDNGIEYDAETGRWYGAYSGGQGGVVSFASLSDLLAFQNPTTYEYSTNVADNEMGIAIACFGSGTLIETDGGPIAVEALKEGDLIRTLDNGYQPIRWIGSRKILSDELSANPSLRPIKISAGSLAVNSPVQDLLVSPQHRVLVRSKIAYRMFGAEEVLVATKQLLELDGVNLVEDAVDVEYFHILLDRHEIVFSNGALTESFYMGEQALKSVDTAAREEILQIFPELANQKEVHFPESARMLISGRPGRNLAGRHVKNTQNLIDEHSVL